tara:strand:+ start:4579 stop:5436 length:858 start_codon:yes stop_codon:yes gene_type:complete
MKKTFPRHLAAIAALSVLLTGGIAHAGELPAVSKLNGSASLSGVYHNQDNLSEGLDGLLSGSVSVPLTHNFGFQADASLATTDDDGAAGIGGHLFWRDPAKGLIGLTTSYVTFPNVSGQYDFDMKRFGAESEFYLGNITLSFSGGYQNGHNTDDGSYGTAMGYWYANDNLRLGIGATKNPLSDTDGIIDAEWQPNFAVESGMTLFAGTTFGRNNLLIAQTGIRFYFSDPKTLKQRNREDDPVIMTDEILSQVNPTLYANYCAGKVPYVKYTQVTCGATQGYTPPI